MEAPDVAGIRELWTNSDNLLLEVVSLTSADVEEALHTLDTLGVDIERMEVMKQERANPFNHFGQEFADEEDTG